MTLVEMVRRFRLSSALAVAILTSAVSTGCPERSEEHVRKANVLFSNHDLAGAEAEYRRAIEKGEGHAGALEGLGDVCFERGDYASSASWYEKAARAEPRAITPLHRWAIALSSQGRAKDAIEVLSKAVEIDPKDVFALHVMGGQYQKLGESKKAEEMQMAVLRIDKDHRAARFALANIQLDSGRFEEAERELTRLEIEGKDARPLAEYGFARLAALRGGFDEAARHLERVIDLGVAHPGKVLTDTAFAEGWSQPSMLAVRAKLEAAVSRDPKEARTSTGTPR
jgi:tetratricopeptide (TPR) repeat protein